jgi:hypothetical protein
VLSKKGVCSTEIDEDPRDTLKRPTVFGGIGAGGGGGRR